MSVTAPRPPRDNLFRASFPALELREDSEGEGDGDATPVMEGHFARFDEWTEIDSIWEGRFLERIAKGTFRKTFREQRAAMKVLFQHGRDPQIGDKPLGPIEDLREDDEGAYYEVPLLDAPYVRDTLLPGLRAGLYGASFRFRVVREEINEKPKRTDHNPDGLPERTIKEAEVMEFGPVTFPAYAGATAGVRSLTDDFWFHQLQRADPERLRALLDRHAELHQGVHEDTHDQPEVAPEVDSTPPKAPEARKTAPGPSPTPLRGNRTRIYGRKDEAWRL